MDLQIDPLEILIQTYEFICLVILGIYDYCKSFCYLFIPAVCKSIKNDVILVTGGASGIGREVCSLLVKNGAKTLVLWDCNKSENEKAASELRAMGANVYTYLVDVSDKLSVSQGAQKVQKEVGDVSILYNNAGVTHIADLLDQSCEQIERQIKINLLSHFWTIKEFLPKMIENKKGHVVTMCSILGLKGVLQSSAYSASKYGVRGYLQSLESEIRHLPSKPDIQFTTIFPFFVDTPLITGLKVNYRMGFLFKHLTPQFVASKVVEGILTNTHSVYIPWHLPYLMFLENLGPRKTAERVMDFFIKNVQMSESTGIPEKTNNPSLSSKGKVVDKKKLFISTNIEKKSTRVGLI